ncbi:MAG: 3-hydroxyacyl-CoA dehydrogenase [Phenylobacterium sp.]|nr:3-hydroxyacyl-CoA dehydrogenase [Phenylobacterium sp.]
MILEGRVAIVTGAGRGIGQAVARTLAAEGAKVVVNDYGVDADGLTPRSGPAAETVELIRQAGGEAVANAGSVADEADVAALVQTALDAFGRIDILVNNAGIIIRNLLLETPVADWDRQVATHLRAGFLTARAAAPHMQAQGFGRIVNFTSLSGLVGMPGSNAYTAAKAGVLGLTWLLAAELCFYGITVNAVAPSGSTRMDVGFPQSVQRLRRAYGAVGATPVTAENRPPEAVGALVAYLASEEAAYINGQTIAVTGDRISLWSRPEITASAFETGPWTVEALRRRFRATLGEGLVNDPPELSTT